MTRHIAAAALPLAAVLAGCGAGSTDSALSDGSGGAANEQPPVSYGGGTLVGGEHGHFPSTVSEADAQSAFESWRADYVVSCGDAGLRVRGERDGETLSEGIGHGALLAVAWDDQATFDGIWTYYRNAAAASDAKKGAEHGLMGWRMWGDACAFTEVEPGAASYADLNMAMALLQAECRWGGSAYYYGALAVADAVRRHMTAEVAGRTVLLPSDMSDGAGCMNSSYSAPAYYRVFARAQPEQAEFWSAMADHAYVLLGEASHASTGLVPDWAAVSGASCSEATDFVGYDAIRTHWRAATDYVWFGTPEPQSWLEKVTSWVRTEIGVEQLPNLQDGFFADGSEILGAPNQANSAFLGAIAVGAIPVDQETTDAFHAVFRDVPPANDHSYYTMTARALYLLLSVNKFSPGCY